MFQIYLKGFARPKWQQVCVVGEGLVAIHTSSLNRFTNGKGDKTLLNEEVLVDGSHLQGWGISVLVQVLFH